MTDKGTRHRAPTTIFKQEVKMALLKSINVPLGTKAIDFCLKGIDGEKHSLADYDDKEVLVIMIMCNHCPYVQAVDDRLVQLHRRVK